MSYIVAEVILCLKDHTWTTATFQVPLECRGNELAMMNYLEENGKLEGYDVYYASISYIDEFVVEEECIEGNEFERI